MRAYIAESNDVLRLFRPLVTQDISVLQQSIPIERFDAVADVDPGKVRADLGVPGGGPLLVCVSRLVPGKGQHHLVATAAPGPDDLGQHRCRAGRRTGPPGQQRAHHRVDAQQLGRGQVQHDLHIALPSSGPLACILGVCARPRGIGQQRQGGLRVGQDPDGTGAADVEGVGGSQG